MDGLEQKRAQTWFGRKLQVVWRAQIGVQTEVWSLLGLVPIGGREAVAQTRGREAVDRGDAETRGDAEGIGWRRSGGMQKGFSATGGCRRGAV